AWIAALRTQGPVRAPWADPERVLESLCSLPQLPRIALAEELEQGQVQKAPVPCLRLEDAKKCYGCQGGWAATLCCRYGDAEIAQGRRAAAFLDSTERRV